MQYNRYSNKALLLCLTVLTLTGYALSNTKGLMYSFKDAYSYALSCGFLNVFLGLLFVAFISLNDLFFFDGMSDYTKKYAPLIILWAYVAAMIFAWLKHPF